MVEYKNPLIYGTEGNNYIPIGGHLERFEVEARNETVETNMWWFSVGLCVAVIAYYMYQK